MADLPPFFHGHIEGGPTIIISTCRGAGDYYFIQYRPPVGQQGKRTPRLPCRLTNSITGD